MLKRRCCFLLLIVFLGMLSMSAQKIAVKTNSLYWLTTTVNAGLEVELNKKYTVELFGAYNPWTLKEDRKMRFWLAQPELKYWFCEAFEGHFVGVHLHGAQYYGVLNNKRYDGYLAGGGVSYGYDWILSPRWNIEAEVGLGYARLWYDESPDIPCNKCSENKHKNYWGPTRLALSISYLF